MVFCRKLPKWMAFAEDLSVMGEPFICVLAIHLHWSGSYWHIFRFTWKLQMHRFVFCGILHHRSGFLIFRLSFLYFVLSTHPYRLHELALSFVSPCPALFFHVYSTSPVHSSWLTLTELSTSSHSFSHSPFSIHLITFDHPFSSISHLPNANRCISSGRKCIQHIPLE